MVLGNWISKCKRKKLDPYLYNSKKINSKWIKDFKCKTWNWNSLEETWKKKNPNIGLGNDFLDKTPKMQAIKAKNKQVGLCQIKELLYINGKNNLKRWPMGWEEIFVGHMSDKGVISKVCKELIHSTAKIKKSIFFFLPHLYHAKFLRPGIK